MKIRLWLVRLLLGRQTVAVQQLDESSRYLILYNPHVVSPEAFRYIAQACRGCTAIPVRVDLMPEGFRITDALAFYPITVKE